MRMIKHQRHKDGVRQKDESWAQYTLRWPCYTFHIAADPAGIGLSGPAAQIIRPQNDGSRIVWLYGDDLAKNGIRGLFRTIWQPPETRRSGRSDLAQVPWPDEGVFVPSGWRGSSGQMPPPVRVYDPVEVLPTLLRAVQLAAEDKPSQLLTFIGTWGALGVGLPDDPDFPLDGVNLTRTWLRSVASWLEGYHALKLGEPSSPKWDTLTEMLNDQLVGVHPIARLRQGKLLPQFRPRSLLDTLWLGCWQMATDGDDLRRCLDCRSLFLPGRRNQYYCDRLCANRHTVRNAKRKRSKSRRKTPVQKLS